MLSKITNKDEKTLYAHIWDICSQMDNYIFQKASDRVISKSNESSGDNYINNIIQPKKSFDKPNQDEEEWEKFKSIVDFPTFLLHVYKLTFLEEKQNENNDKNFTIDKNKLLEIIKIEEKESREKAKKFIENLLKYRILFDYFVIKSQDDMENSYKIRRLSKEDKAYTISEKSNEMPDLAMVQNYLRVARSGMSNNHHHWLTPFLKFLDKEINLNFSFDGLNDDGKIINKIQINNNINFDDFITEDKNYFQKNLISFLENLDTTLAKEQANDDKKDSLEISNEVLIKLKIESDQMSIENTFLDKDTQEIPNLDQGTATPHYWFYRLEYYLWKYSKIEYSLENNVKLKEIKLDNKTFDYVASSFYFRSLNSIEHVQAQSKAQEWGDNADKIDNFGNLALISSSFNSSLNNQDTQDKYLDLQKYINKDSVISLKLWLIYALSKKDQSKWTFEKAKEHKNQMLEVLKNSFKSYQDKA